MVFSLRKMICFRPHAGCSPSSPLYHCARVSKQVCTLVIPGCPGSVQGVNETSVASRAKLDVLSVFAPMPQKTCQERSGVSCSPGSESWGSMLFADYSSRWSMMYRQEHWLLKIGLPAPQNVPDSCYQVACESTSRVVWALRSSGGWFHPACWYGLLWWLVAALHAVCG